MIQLCVSCEYWFVFESDKTLGICKRHAPRPRVYAEADKNTPPGTNQANWPHTGINDGCAEGDERKEPVEFETPDEVRGMAVPKLPGSNFNQIVEQAKERIKNG